MRTRNFQIGIAIGCLTALSFLAHTVDAQLRLSQEFTRSADIDTDLTDLIGEDRLETTIKSTKVKLSVPIVFSRMEVDGKQVPSKVLFASLFYRLRQFERDTVSPQLSMIHLNDFPAIDRAARDDKYHSIGGTAMWLSMRPGKWGWVGFVGLDLSANELSDGGLGDLRLDLGLMLRYQYSSGWVFGFGPVVLRATGKAQILPALDIEYEDDRKKIHLFGPKFDVWHKLTRSEPLVSVGLIAELDGDSYIVPDRTVDLYDESGRLEKSDVDLAVLYTNLNVGGAVQLTFQNVALRVVTGMSGLRTFKFRSPKEGKTLHYGGPNVPAVLQGEAIDFSVQAAPFVRVVMKYGIGFGPPED